MTSEINYPDIYTPFLALKRRYKVLCGGRGSAKSRFLALMACIRASQGHKVVCAREFQSSIKHSVYALVKDTINKYKVTGFTLLKASIEHESGGELVFIGLGRNPDAARSLENAAVCWVEEAQFLTQETLDTLRPSIRGDDSEIWLSGNPKRSNDPFSLRFVERTLPHKIPEYPSVTCDHIYMRVHTTYKDNPFFPQVLELEREDDYEQLSRDQYNHIWLGAYSDTVEHAIIRAEWFDAAIDAHKRWKKFGMVTAVHDPADNNDARATIVRHGNTIIAAHEETKLDINAAMEQACDLARENNATFFIYDATGCGLGLRQQVVDYFGNAATISEFHGGSKPQNYDEPAIFVNEQPVANGAYFKNLRAQLYFNLSERFRKTYQAVEKGEYIDPHELISISSDIGETVLKQLRQEICSVPRKLGSERSYQLMSKNEMSTKMKLKSPNLADCLMMSELEMTETSDWFNEKPGSADIQVA